MIRSGSIAFFISPHGLGHAARAAALMQELHRQAPGLTFLLVTSAPEWFFAESTSAPFERVDLSVDVGLVQRTATEEDLDATVQALARLYPPRPAQIEQLAALLRQHGCAAAVADIAPLGLAAARAAGIPAVLVENFTWDWIYQGYAEASPELARIGAELAGLFATADLHLQAAPVCRPGEGTVRVGAIARRPRRSRPETRRALGVAASERLVTLSMGGFPERFDFAGALADRPERFLLVGQQPGAHWPDNVIALPHRSGHYHPDLLVASDVLVGKLGYSTVAEAWRAGVDWLWLDRPAFVETAVLADHVRRHHRQVRLEPGSLQGAEWVDALDRLQGPRPVAAFDDGSAAAAAAILRRI